MELEQLLERAHSLGEEGNWELMADLLREHLSDFQDEPAVHCWLGVAERELGLEGVAYERFKRAITLEPEDPYVLATAGNGIAAFDDEDAERVLRTAALTAPDLPLTRLMYGAYLSREGFHEQAQAELDAARALEPEDPQIAYELGVARALGGDTDGAADAVADVITAKEERDLSDMLNGISKDGMAKELQDMRDLRHEMRAEARVSREMAGTDSKQQEAQFLEYARSNTASDEFDSLLGMAEGTEGAETSASEPEEVEKTGSDGILPE